MRGSILPTILLTTLVLCACTASDPESGGTSSPAPAATTPAAPLPDGMTAAQAYEQGLAKYEAEDYAGAVELWQPLADRGHAEVQFRMGMMSLRGQAMAKDFTRAADWFRKSGEQGHDQAQTNLGGLLYTGKGVDRDPAEAVVWFRRAAEQGHALAQYNLGTAYRDGDGVAQDPVEAFVWYSLAGSQAQAQAGEQIQKVAAGMTPEQIAAGERLYKEREHLAGR